MLTNVGARVYESDLKVGFVVMRACVYVIVHDGGQGYQTTGGR